MGFLKFVKWGVCCVGVFICLLVLVAYLKFPWVFENDAAPGVSGPLIPVVIDDLERKSHGADVYSNNCAYCHERGVGPNLRDKAYSVGVLQVFVRNGMGAMPAIPVTHVSDDDLEKIAAYLVTSGDSQ